jgi:hypothetical protein
LFQFNQKRTERTEGRGKEKGNEQEMEGKWKRNGRERESEGKSKSKERGMRRGREG